MPDPQDIRTIQRLAAHHLGNPAIRAAKAARDAAIGRLGAACQRGESAEVMTRLQAEVDAAKTDYRRARRSS